jgi:hypothetical protein
LGRQLRSVKTKKPRLISRGFFIYEQPHSYRALLLPNREKLSGLNHSKTPSIHGLKKKSLPIVNFKKH